jgi:SNW domain-containing protein 1
VPAACGEVATSYNPLSLDARRQRHHPIAIPVNMAATGSAFSLSSALPKPKYTGEDEDLPTHTQQKGPRVVDSREIESSQLVVKRSGPPPYGQRSSWRPRNAEDFGDGGAFPEVPVAQYPLDMGRKGGSTSSSNALAIQVNGEGKVKYDAIARRGHDEKRIIHASFKDLIPLRQRADAGEINLEKPSEEEVQAAKERTQKALSGLVAGALAAQKPKNIKGTSRPEPTFVRYTPANQMGDGKKGDRIMKIVQRQQDPMEPPKHKIKKVPRGPPSPPPPVMHSPPRKLTAEDQEAWRIPPPISNWKNPKGYTVPLDKRLAADGRGLQDVTINDKFAQFAEALQTADSHAREEVQQRQRMQQRLAEKEKEAKEENLRMLAQKAREERTGAASGQRDARSRSRSHSVDSRSSYSSYSSRSRSRSRSGSRGRGDPSERDRLEREKARAERRKEAHRELRQKNMGHERRVQMNRDVSEKVALGLAKPTQNKEAMYDSRLFNQSSGFAAGFNEDQAYDKPLFAERDALNSIYRPNVGDDDDDDGGETLDKIQGTKRFESLGKAPKEGFKGTDAAEQRSGPVMFERDRGEADPFGVEAMVAEAAKGAKRGAEDDAGGKGKKARVDDE